MAGVRVSVIVVSWNTRELLRRCLQSVEAASTPDEVEVFVVENASSDGSAEMVASEFPGVRLIVNRENVGFARANNQAIESASGDYLLLLNPDAEVVGRAMSLMAEWLDGDPAVAVVGPRLLNPDGSTQSSRRRFPSRSVAFLESTVLQRWFGGTRPVRRFYVEDADEGIPQLVDWVVGACFMVRAAAAREVGYLDDGYFMYFEELDWCRRFAARGWKTVYLPEARVIHHGGQGAEQAPARLHQRFQYSKALYHSRYHGAWFGAVLRVFILATYLFLLVEDAVKLPIAGKRGMRGRRIGVLARVVAWQVGWVLTLGRLRP